MQDLLTHIYDKVGTKAVALKTGFPPERIWLETFDPGRKLEETGLKLNGAQVVIEVLDGTGKEKEEEGSTANKGPASGAAGKPTSAPAKNNPAKDDPPDIPIPGRGVLVLRVMADDNSCLFRALSYTLTGGMVSPEELRSMVASTIASNPDTYSAAVLDQDPGAYCEWINMPSSWGGGIECVILSKEFGSEVVAVDVATGSTIRFNEGAGQMVVLVYSGIHYDAVAVSPYRNADPEMDERVFQGGDEEVVKAAVKLAGELKKRHYHTDTKNFALKCNDCGTALRGQKAAAEHSLKTGHANFGEYEG